MVSRVSKTSPVTPRRSAGGLEHAAADSVGATTPVDAPPAPPARRNAVSAKSEQRIRDILRVGREVFAEKGYERATTLEVAQRLGISEATVFTYFRGKRELCVRVIGDWYDEIIATMQAGLPSGAPARAQLDFFVRTHLRLFLIQGTGLCALVLSEGRSRGQELGESFLPFQRRYTAPLMDVLARGQASGEIRTDLSLRLLRPMVLGPMEHILWEAVGQPDKPVDIEATADALVSMLWSAVAAPDSELVALRGLQRDVQAALARTASAGGLAAVPDRFDAVRGAADVHWQTDALMKQLRADD